MPYTKPEIIAHRGLHESARENTIEAFDLAVKAGANAVELDVHRTVDGRVVVHHDFDIKWGEKAVPLATASFDQAHKAAATAGFELPLLADVLTRFSGRLKIYIEVKAASIELDVARVIRESDCELAVHSFDHRIVSKIRDFVPGVQTGVLTVSRPIDPVGILKSANSRDYWPQVDFVDADLVNEVHEFGGRVIVWTANQSDQWERLRTLGVDAICTDKPDVLRDWLNASS